MKEFWLMGITAKRHSYSLVSLFLRVFISIYMLSHGLSKIESFVELSATFPNPLGIGSEASLVLSIFAEVACSFLLLIGLFTRLAAFTLVINMMVATMLVMSGNGFSAHELGAIYLAVYLSITVLGGGFYSLDWLLFTRNFHFTGKYCNNILPLDRMIRLLLGLLCWFLIFADFVTTVWLIVLLLLLSVPLFLTSFWGYCPLYAVFFKGENKVINCSKKK